MGVAAETLLRLFYAICFHHSQPALWGLVRDTNGIERPFKTLIIPTCIMIYCYSRIVRVVWLRAGPLAARNIDEPRVHFRAGRSDAASDPAAVCISGVVGSPDHQPSPHRPCRQSLQMDSQVAVSVPRRLTLMTKRSVIRMAMSVTVGFMVCWTPFIVVSSVRIYSDYRYPWKTAKVVSVLLALSHSAVNPLLYIVFSSRAVRAAFVHLCQRAQPGCFHSQ